MSSPADGAKSGDALNADNATTPTTIREAEDATERLAGDGDDGSIQDGSLSRCHNRSVSHDSYFRLLMTSRTGMQADPLDEEGDASPEASGCQALLANDVIYAEISKPGTKSMELKLMESPSIKRHQSVFVFDVDSKEESRRTPQESHGQEFGINMNLTAVEDPHSSSSKLSLNDLSHLDDSELNIMNSREMLAVSKKLSDSSSHQQSSESSNGGSGLGRARPASVDDSVIDDSARVSRDYCFLVEAG